MAAFATLLSVALLVILGHHVTNAQVALATIPLTAQGTCISPGLFPNPADCNGYLQCAADHPTPYTKKCSPGTLFHPERRECLGENSVVCFPRPRTDRMIHHALHPAVQVLHPAVGTVLHPALHPQVIPTVYQALGTHVVTGSNTVVLRLIDPLLRPDQCTNIGQQMTRYMRQIVSNNQPHCGANTACWNNLPVFRVDCLTSNGRLLV